MEVFLWAWRLLVWKNFTEVSKGHDNSSSIVEVGDIISLKNVANLL
jgi:hypothetical protein